MFPHLKAVNFLFSQEWKKGNLIFWSGKGLCVKKLSLPKYVRDQKWTRGKTELQRVLSFNRRTYACKTHQKYSVWFCKSFLSLFFPCTCREGELGTEGSVLSTMTGRVTRLHQLFTIRHVLSNKEQWRQGEIGY